MTQPTKPPVFHCQQCGDCCAGRGGISVRPQEVEQMAAFLEIDPQEFSRQYVENSPSGARLATGGNGSCVFLMPDHRCRVHPVKPPICRQWPFLPVLLRDPEELEYAKGACPGIDPECSHADFVAAAMNISNKID